MGVHNRQPLAKDKGVHREEESEELVPQGGKAYSKVLPRGTRITLGTTGGMRLPNKSKSKDYADAGV